MKRLALAIVPLLVILGTAAGATVSAQTGTPAAEEGEYALAVANDPNLGAILTGPNGMTVYLFTKDTDEGVSNCYDQCAVNWPPVPATDNLELPDGVPGELTAIDRTDGSKQLAYNGIPLYYFIKDQAAGDVTGQDVGGVWFVVPPGATYGPYAPAPGEGTPVPQATLRVGFTEELGPFLTDAKGMTLYLFTKDTTAGESACYDQCAVNWPPVPADEAAMLPVGIQGTFGSIDRTDGSKQLTYNDIPLYYYIKDQAPGDTTGQEVGDVWYIVPPDTKLGDPPHETEGGEEGGTPESGY